MIKNTPETNYIVKIRSTTCDGKCIYIKIDGKFSFSNCNKLFNESLFASANTIINCDGKCTWTYE